MDNETLTCTLSNLNHHNTKGDTAPPVKVYTPLGRENGMSNCLYLASNCEKCASRHLSEFVRSWRVCFPDEGRPRSRHPHRRQHPHQDGLLRGWRRGHTTVSCWDGNWQTCWPLYTYITFIRILSLQMTVWLNGLQQPCCGLHCGWCNCCGVRRKAAWKHQPQEVPLLLHWGRCSGIVGIEVSPGWLFYIKNLYSGLLG